MQENSKEKLMLIIKKNGKALRSLRATCKKEKKALSVATQATVDIDTLMDGEDLNIFISRFKFKDL